MESGRSTHSTVAFVIVPEVLHGRAGRSENSAAFAIGQIYVLRVIVRLQLTRADRVIPWQMAHAVWPGRSGWPDSPALRRSDRDKRVGSL